jgi:hypothetical protein
MLGIEQGKESGLQQKLARCPSLLFLPRPVPSYSTIKVAAASFSKTLVKTYYTACRHIPEDSNCQLCELQAFFSIQEQHALIYPNIHVNRLDGECRGSMLGEGVHGTSFCALSVVCGLNRQKPTDQVIHCTRILHSNCCKTRFHSDFSQCSLLFN